MEMEKTHLGMTSERLKLQNHAILRTKDLTLNQLSNKWAKLNRQTIENGRITNKGLFLSSLAIASSRILSTNFAMVFTIGLGTKLRVILSNNFKQARRLVRLDGNAD